MDMPFWVAVGALMHSSHCLGTVPASAQSAATVSSVMYPHRLCSFTITRSPHDSTGTTSSAALLTMVLWKLETSWQQLQLDGKG